MSIMNQFDWPPGAAARLGARLLFSIPTTRFRQMKEGLARMPRVQLYTPRDESLSSGIVCFDVKGMKPGEVVKRLLDQRIVASTTPYRISYARVACSIVNTPREVDMVVRAIHELA